MKKTILLFSFMGAGIVISNAQITVTQADVAGVGKMLLQASDTIKSFTTGSINPGPAGANQTWNFTTLLSDIVDTMYFTNPAWTPQGSSFPNANIAVTTTRDSTVTYLENKSTGLFVVGAFADPTGQGNMVIMMNPAEELISFNNTYGSTFTNTSAVYIEMPFTQQPGFDSIRVKHSVLKDVKTDGWGNVITPLGTFNSLRTRGQMITIDSIWAHVTFPPTWIVPTAPVIDTSYHFAWWANGVGFPLVEFDSTKGDTIRNITWLKTLPVIGGINETASFSEVTVFPNPSSGQFSVYSQQTINYELEIYNVVGERVFQTTTNRKEETINLNVPNGIYFMHITSKEGTAIRKLIIGK